MYSDKNVHQATIRVLTSALMFSICISFFSCKKTPAWFEVDPAYSKYIEAYTSGIISKTSTVSIRLTTDASTTHTIGQPVSEKLFEFNPAIKGKAVWADARTIEFRPDEKLKPGQLYEAIFYLNKATKVPVEFKEFKFQFQALTPAFTVTEAILRSSGEMDKMFLEGEIETADSEDNAKVEKLLKAEYPAGKVNIIWQHNGNARTHKFTINNIVRQKSETSFKLTWNGKSLDIENKGEQVINIPAIGIFKVLNVMSVNDAHQYASIQFSDAIAVGQDLTGLITISNNDNITYTINGSEIKAYAENRLEGNYTVYINPGIKNTWGISLPNSFTGNIVFENRLPSVKIHGKGNILPNTGKLVLPFEAVNLNAVDISIIKIFEDNVPQFLQENNLEGYNELRRVAKPIVQKTLRLDDDKGLDLHKKQRFTLDIDRFLKTEPGAVYRITIGFRKEYSLFEGSDIATTEGEDGQNEEYEEYEDEGEYEYYGRSSDGNDNDDDFWDQYDDYYPAGYNWNRRDDPMSRSYYNKSRWATRNILASNIGITAKRGNNNSIKIAVTDILTAEPMDNVEIDILNYQQRIIGKFKSGNDGFGEVELEEKPWLLIAKKGKERGYLKLSDGNSLLMSMFDVQGEEVKNGLKGFIFGERGVWRPGDSMYLSCIIEDESGSLPKEHPVEFSLITPQGQLYRQAVQNNADDGFYVFRTSTASSAPTGNWLVKAKVGGAVFEKRLKVETVMPNRLKINLDFGKDAILGKDNSNMGTLNASWLFGAPGKDLKATVDASLYSGKTSFQKFSAYTFDDPTSNYSTQSKVIFDSKLDDAGKGIIKTDFEIEGAAPGMLTANLLVKVFEPGGSFSIDNMSIPYSPYSSYAGIKMPQGEKPFDFLLAGKNHTVQMVNVDSKGNLVTGNNDMEVLFYRIQWRWWWDDGGDDLSNFTENQYKKLLKKEDITLTNGRGQWTFKSGTTDWGRYLILVKDKKSGHTTGESFYIDEPGWQSRAGTEEQTAATMLSFTSNKPKFEVGENIQLSVPTPEKGRLLVSIENGSKVIRTFWQETKKGQTQIKFRAEKEMAPNIYATVSLLQPHRQSLNDLPVRMYGSIPLFIEDKNTVLKPVISMPATLRPEQPFSMTVSEAVGKEMTYTIAIVDDGLLDLTRFKTPDPHAAFYAREALGVKSFDMYDQVIGAWGGDLERLLTIGGDMDAGPSKQKTANRFKPVVKFIGPFHSGKGQKKTHQLQLPAYIGSVRAMVVAAHEGSYGKAEKTVPVKKPLMVLATMPRVLSPGELLRLPVTVFVMENNIRKVNVTLLSNSFFEVSGGNTRTVDFSSTGDQMAYFDVRVKEVQGVGKVKVTGAAGKETASDEIEIDIRNPNPFISDVKQLTLSPGQKWQVTTSPIGIPSASTAVIEISSIPSMNLHKRLNYLIQYPHGCIEQTTSAVFPQLVLKQLTDLDDYRKGQIDKNIKAGISKLQNFQRSDGGFAYWPGAPSSDDWGSSYAGHFLIEARNNGYFVSEAVIQQWKNYQRNKANSWVPTSTNFYGGDLAQAYRLYTLALAKAPEPGAMNRLKEFKYISSEAKWRLAAAYKLAGQNNAALDLISGEPTSFPMRTYTGFTYGSDLRDEAMVLETLTLMGNRKKATELVQQIANRLSEENWYSTQTTAYCLIAIAKFCGVNPSGAKIMATATISGNSININSQTYLKQLPVVFKKGPVNSVITNNGSNVLYIKAVTQGQPLTGDTFNVASNTGALDMTISYIGKNGKPLDISKLTKGTDFIAKVIIKNPGNRGTYTQMALSQVFAAGWEILNPRMMEGEGAFKSSAMTYQDVRDDRVYTYFNIKENEVLTYYVQLNSSYPGRYYLPPVNCEAMYDNTISSSNKGRWVEVTEQ